MTYGLGGEISDPTAQPVGKGRTVPAPIDKGAELQKAADLAKSADVAIVFVGTDNSIEGEGLDRKSLGLSGNQEELVKRSCRQILARLSC